MGWKAYDYDERKPIGAYPDEPAMAKDIRERFEPGFRLIVENDDGALFEAFRDSDTVKIITDPPLALQEIRDAHDDENYSIAE